MSSLTGSQLEEDYFQIGEVKLPLPKSPVSSSAEYEMMRTTPLEPFQASVVLGDDSLISDDRIAQVVWSDFRPGLGKRKYTETESVSGYQDGDLLTVEGVATLPPYRNTLIENGASGCLDTTVANGDACGFGFDWSQRYRFALWSPGASLPYVWDSNVSQFITLSGPTAEIPPFSAYVRFGRYWVLCLPTSIWTSTDGHAYTQAWTPGGTLSFLGIVKHDGKLYAAVRDSATNGVVLRWLATEAQLTAGTGTAWPSVSVDVVVLDTNEVLVNLVDWKDKNGDRQIFMITTRRIIAYDDEDFFTDFWPVPDPSDTHRPYGYVNLRDDLLYVCFGKANNSVFVFNHQTIEQMGPNREFGIPKGNPDFNICLLGGNSRHLFALGTGQQGRILIANDAFGWGGFLRATLSDPSDLSSNPVSADERITGMLYFGSRLIYVLNGGGVGYIDWPDEDASVYNFLPSGPPYSRANATGPFYLYSAEFDASAALLWKLAKYWTIHIERSSGAFSLASGCKAYFFWWVDGGAFSTPIAMTDADTFPFRIPLPSLDDQRGSPFRKVNWAIGLEGAPVSFNYDPPILVAVALAYTREPDIYDGLQVVVDLSTERWDQLPTGLFYGKSRQFLREYIDTLKSGPEIQPKRHYPVEIGFRGYKKTYKAMDVRVSGVEDPQDRYGKFSLTLRDVTAPVSG